MTITPAHSDALSFAPEGRPNVATGQASESSSERNPWFAAIIEASPGGAAEHLAARRPVAGQQSLRMRRRPPRTDTLDPATVRWLESLTADLDDEFVADKFGPLSPEDRRLWARAKRKTGSQVSARSRGASMDKWTELQRRRPVGRTIRTFSVAKGLLKGSFTVEALSSGRIEVSSKGMKAPPRAISRGDFEKVAGLWSAYKAGTLTRSGLIHESQNTTYIIGLLHWLETEGEAPR